MNPSGNLAKLKATYEHTHHLSQCGLRVGAARHLARSARTSSTLVHFLWADFKRRDEPPEFTWLFGRRGGDAFLFAPTPPKRGWRGGERAKKMLMHLSEVDVPSGWRRSHLGLSSWGLNLSVASPVGFGGSDDLRDVVLRGTLFGLVDRWDRTDYSSLGNRRTGWKRW